MIVQTSHNTKIVATVGPACDSYDKLLELALAGVNVFRLNFSHGSHDDHKLVMDRLHEINKNHGFHLGILADLQGPKLRVGVMEGEGLPIKKGDILTFTNEECVGNSDKIYMSYKGFAKDVRVGERVLVDDGKIVLEVSETDLDSIVKLKVIHGDMLKSKKGVNLPDTSTSLPCLTEKDLKDLDFILTQEVHWIALSFVRRGEDISALRKILDEHNYPARILAKIEKPEAIENIRKIIKKSNGIMVARGDLGVELPIEKIPVIQKNIIKMCNQWARPVIVATQMMESMITNPSPSRAEATDVANAVLDGADAVMLSGETSVGNHPVEVVKAMKRIAEASEGHIIPNEVKLIEKTDSFLSDVICESAAKVASKIKAKAIVGFTSSGYTAFKMSSFRPKCKIYMFSDNQYLLKVQSLTWGVKCFFYDKFSSTDENIHDVTEILKAEKLVVKEDLLVNTGSMPVFRRLKTNMLKITKVE